MESLRISYLSFCGILLILQGINGFDTIPTNIQRIESRSTEELTLHCRFILDQGIKVDRLEWQATVGGKSTSLFTLSGSGEVTKLNNNFKDTFTITGLEKEKDVSIHSLTIRQLKELESLSCLVLDTTGRTGEDAFIPQPFGKEKIKSGSESERNNETCGGDLNATAGAIVSPNYPSRYPENSVCEWRITAQPGQIINFEFILLDLEDCCTCDYLEIRDGLSENSTLIQKICSDQRINDLFQTRSNEAYVKFISDFSIEEFGFQIFYEATPPVVCGGNYTGSSGVINSPNYPDNYPEWAECEYVITVDPGLVITLEFPVMDLESCVACQCDNLQVRDGPTDLYPLIGGFCTDTSAIITSSFNSVYIKFKSDRAVTGQGFHLTWQSKVDNSSTPTCGESVGGTSGIIETPGYPGNYPDGAFCAWVILVDGGSTIFLELLEFDLENCCECDFVEIRDGPGPEFPLLATFCDPLNVTSTSVTTSGRSAYVSFRSDSGISAPGFRLYWIGFETNNRRINKH